MYTFMLIHPNMHPPDTYLRNVYEGPGSGPVGVAAH